MEEAIDFSLAEKYFQISPNGAENAAFSVPAADLLRPETMNETLRRSGEMLGAFGPELAASFVGLAFFNVCAVSLIFLSQSNRELDLSLDNLTLQLVPHGKLVVGAFRVMEKRWRPVPETEREAAVARYLTELFRKTINPVVESAAAHAGVKPDLIWNQYGARMAWVRDFVQELETRSDFKERFARDYELLAGGLSPDVFNRRKNPFAHNPRYVDSPWQPGKKVILRSSCCMYYRREDGQKCYNCPLLTDQERERMRKAIEASRDHSA